MGIAIDTVPSEERPGTLTELAAAVRTARQAVQDLRRVVPVSARDLRVAQSSLLQALDAYVSELTVRRLPVPYRLRNDLRLHRQLRPHDSADRLAPFRRAGAR